MAEGGEAQIFPILQKCAILNPNPHSFYMSVLVWQYGEVALSCTGLEFSKSPNIHIWETGPMSSPSSTIAPWLPALQVGTLAKSYSNSLFITIQNKYLKPPHGSPRCMCYVNIHEHTWTALGCRPNSCTDFAFSFELAVEAPCSMSGKTYSHQGHHFGET